MQEKLLLSEEQNIFMEKALEGKNILVDACIGSGKTTAIQRLCNLLPTNKKILYLTYNKLLKLDAKNRIYGKNILVNNYHGFAYYMLKRNGKTISGVSDLIQTFVNEFEMVCAYDVLIIDEYQDIETEMAKLLEIVKNSNPSVQIIAVGDMEQKIYDKTTLDVRSFITNFLGEYMELKFTKCFRISSDLASKLGRVWKKDIKGVNQKCIVEHMNQDDVIEFLAKQDTADILCVGTRNKQLAEVLNILEDNYPHKFNKQTVYASIRENDSLEKVEPNKDSAIFTTYDACKGLERKNCIIFDFTEEYWDLRIKNPGTRYEILRNIFCVAASRGKERIIFVDSKEKRLSEQTLSNYVEEVSSYSNRPFDISRMFDFKYREDIEECFSKLIIEKVKTDDTSDIKIKNNDELIDLSPCIGIFQEATFFDGYDIDKEIEFVGKNTKDIHWKYPEYLKKAPLDKKILYLVSLETSQNRYNKQVELPVVSKEQEKLLVGRLSTIFNKDENVQIGCHLSFKDEHKRDYTISGLADVLKNDIVYELKFVSELEHKHFLQCASYMIALKKENGILLNTRNNQMYKIKIKDTSEFLNSLVKTITKGALTEFKENKDKKLFYQNIMKLETDYILFNKGESYE